MRWKLRGLGMCCWDPPTRTGSVLLLTDSRVRETHCFCRRMIWGDFVYTTAEGFREGSVSAQAERERAGRGGVTTESVLFEMSFSLVFFLPRPVLSVKVSSDCAPLCRSLSSRLCRPRPSLRSCLARAPPSGSPDEQQ